MSEKQAPIDPTDPKYPREVLTKLRSEHLEKVKILNDLKERHQEIQTQILSAQDAVFKTFQTFAAASEQFLMGMISEQNMQLNAAQKARLESEAKASANV